MMKPIARLGIAIITVMLLNGGFTSSPAKANTLDGLEIAVTSDGFEAGSTKGLAVEILSSHESPGESYSYVRDSKGQTGFLLELSWLSSPEGTKADLSTYSRVNEPTWFDTQGYLTSGGGVTEEEARVPDDVVETSLLGMLTTTDTVSIALGNVFLGHAKVERSDGVTLEINEGVLVDQNVEAGTEYEYMITGESEAPREDLVEPSPELGPSLEAIQPHSEPGIFTITLKARTLSLEEANAKSLDVAVSPYAVPTQLLNTYVHMTYIPEHTVPIEWYQGIACSGATAFYGDNRGDVTPTAFTLPSHRTALRLAANWQNPDPYKMYWFTTTGPTKKIVDGVHVDTKYADPNGILIYSPWATSSVANAEIVHYVNDPFCTVGSVKYEEVVQIWKSGIVAVNGAHNSVPNHEAYGSYMYNSAGDQAFPKIWNSSNVDYWCLVGWSATCNQTYTASKNMF